MEYFLDTTETIAKGVGFSHYGKIHTVWICVFITVTVLNALLYRKLSSSGKEKWRKAVAILLLLDELFKMVMLFIGGRYTPLVTSSTSASFTRGRNTISNPERIRGLLFTILE